MSVFAIDAATGELIRENGAFVRLNGGEAEILQGCVVAARQLRGEVLLDQDRGIRYLELVFERGVPINLIEAEFADQLSRVPGVLRVSEVTYTPGNARDRAGLLKIEVIGSVSGLAAAIKLADTFTVRPAEI